jgi:hypothetical protein
MDGDESGCELDHGADAAGHGVGNVMQLEVEEKAHARRPYQRRKGIAHTRRAVRQEEFQPELDAADGRFRPAGNGLDELGGLGEIDGVDAAINRVGAGSHGGRNLRAVALPSKRSLFSRNRLGVRTLPQLVDMKIDQSAWRLPRDALAR